MSVPEEIESCGWYHPFVTRHIAESMLLANGKDGTYLIRNSSKAGEFVLSIRCKDSVKHFPLVIEDGCYKFGMGSFSSMQDLVEHFANQPLIGSESGVLTVLKYPYPRNVDEPAGTYDTIKVHAEFPNRKQLSLEEKPDFTVASKEGYLTKQGAIVKNWKTRWFVLQKYELKYFKERENKNPIKVLDLHECTGCETVQLYENRDNCFRIVFPQRIFYIYAASQEEMKEWVELITWKLNHITKDSNDSDKDTKDTAENKSS
ncbi:dual adapter for phosphotyrosine and 3-phosphotyrosine and 3-phosphoinositide-like isoform X2 [Lineus longissimus]|uniref:dual adapter for phosphotyrosine and 3-phosphotyrosine and 3-phosphoinositide-like isoform X2 n=1 Tax=Lineus longissimus TaxID=88925 RepID=UPI002B4F47D8